MSNENIPSVKPKRSLHRKTSSFLAIFITAFLCLLAIIYSSPWGTQATIALLNKYTDVELIYKQGMFSKAIEFSSVSYKDDNLKLSAKDLTLQFHLRCLWQKQLCINLISIDKLSVNSTSNNETTKENMRFEMPFAINAEEVVLNKADIYVGDHHLEFSGVTSAVDISGHVFELNNPVIDLIHVTSINSSNTQVAATQDITQKDESSLELGNIKLPIQLKLNNLAIKSIFNHSTLLTFLPAEFNNVNITTNWLEEKLTISLLKSNYQAGLFEIKGDIAFIDNYPLAIEFNHQLISNNYWQEINHSKQSVNLSGDLSQLNIQLKSEGSLELIGNASINLINGDLPYSLQLAADKIPLYNQLSQHLHPSKLQLTTQGNINAQHLSLKSVINGLGYKDATVSFKLGHLKSTQNQLDPKVSNTKLEHLFTIDEVAINDANNNLSVKGHMFISDKPTWDVKINSTGFSLPTFEFSDSDYQIIKAWAPYLNDDLTKAKIEGRITGKVDSKGIYNQELSAISLTNTDLSGQINNIPFVLKGEVDLKENLELKPSHLTLSIDDSIITLSGFSDNEWHLQSNIEVPQISRFIPEIKGGISTTLNLSGPIKKPTIHFNNNITDLVFKQLKSELINLQGSYSPFKQHTTSAQIKGKSVRWVDAELINLVGKVNANINEQNLDLKWEGNFKSNVLLNSHWNEKNQRWTGVIAGAGINYLSHHWAPDTDIIVQYDHNSSQISLNKHCWNNPGLTLCLPKNVSFFDSGNLPLSINFNSTYFNNTLTPKDISLNTTIRGEGKITWSPKKDYVLEGDLSVLAGNILLEPEENYLPVKVLSAWDTGRFSFKINDEFAQITSTISPDEQNRADKRYDFYSDIDVSSHIKFENNFPISADINVENFNLRPLQSLNHDLALLEGILSSQVKVSGELEQPQVNGKITLTQGRVKVIKSPNILEEVRLNIDLLGTNATIKGEFNIDKDAGSITGDARWVDEKVLNLNIEADKLSILVPPQIEATIAPKIDAVLTPNHLSISGNVNVIDGILRVTKLPEGSVELTNDVIFVDAQGNEILQEKQFNIESDIKVIIQDRFRLSGQGFDGNLAGSLRVQHNNLQPLQLFGNLNIPDGRYHAYGQRLYIERGKVAFNGPVDNPHIDLRALRTIPKENIKVGLEIKGLANALSLNLFSSPAMSRAQTLSYLLRGQGLANDAADNSSIGVALGAALANYSGILKQIDKLPLINNVEIEGDSSQVSIAGYLGKRIYLKYGIGVEEPINELTIRLFLMSRLWLETISGLENSADIYYSFDTNL